jgi:hypothetical protein
MWFDRIDSIKAFMGEDDEVSHVPAQAQAVLTRFDDRAAHFQVLKRRPAAGNLSLAMPFSLQASVFLSGLALALQGRRSFLTPPADFVRVEFAHMFSIVFAFAVMIAFAAAALNFPALGELPWILSAASGVIFLGAVEAWNQERFWRRQMTTWTSRTVARNHSQSCGD